MTAKFILKCKELIDNVIVIVSDNSWSQDDFSSLIDDFFSQYSYLSANEKVYGADRVEVQTSWHMHRLTLNIESYSESIWLEGSDEQSIEVMKDLFVLMSSAQ